MLHESFCGKQPAVALLPPENQLLGNAAAASLPQDVLPPTNPDKFIL